MANTRTTKTAKLTKADKMRDEWLEIVGIINDTYRIAVFQQGLAARCQLRDCRTENVCQADGILACDCRSSAPVEIFDTVVSLLDLRMMLKALEQGRQAETRIEDIKKVLRFIVAEIATRDASFPPDYLAKLTEYVNRA